MSLFRTTLLIAWLACEATAMAQSGVPYSEIAGGELQLTADGLPLPATREMPETDDPIPCVVFIAGSGPTDRNWNSDMFPASGRNGSAQQLAEALRESGVASVRYDKLGSGANRDHIDAVSMQHYLDEALAAYRHLESEVICQRVFLLGNSEGVIHALRLAVQLQDEPRFGGLIAMSGPSRSMLDLLDEQIRAQSAAAGYAPEQVDAGLAAIRQGVEGLPDTVANPPDFSAMPDLGQFWQLISHSGPPDLLRELMTFDPVAAAAQYRGPILVMSADHDTQVPVSDADALFAATPDVGQLRERAHVANANHVYKEESRTPADTDAMTLMMAYWEAGRPLADGVVTTIASFLSRASRPLP